MMMKRMVLASLGVLALSAGPVHGQDRAGVERAALDYLEGFYEGDESKIRRGVHPEVVKYGFSIPRNGSDYVGEPMSFEQMLAYARSVKQGGRQPSADAPKEVQLLDVLDQTAAVKVTAWWGSDYLLLALYEGEWKVTQVLWQTAPLN